MAEEFYNSDAFQEPQVASRTDQKAQVISWLILKKADLLFSGDKIPNLRSY